MDLIIYLFIFVFDINLFGLILLESYLALGSPQTLQYSSASLGLLMTMIGRQEYEHDLGTSDLGPLLKINIL